MITSINSAIDNKELDLFMKELEERDEMLCFFNACGTAANPCGGQACAAGCIGISVCFLGLHVA
ncbi:hypothetical protein [Paenibacillus sp. GCM10012306]|uniref:hypothetical protein n=1 Tax=Paenibacillus sp. GCM10012306 TaxID=3317342 RepID=UPI00361BE08B